MYLHDIDDEVQSENERLAKISRRLCLSLDCLGYSKTMMQKRRLEYQLAADESTKRANMSVLVVGSRGEGLSKPFESDNDIVWFYPDVTCFDTRVKQAIFSDQTILLMLYTSPGYCMLESVSIDNSVDERISNSLVWLNGKRLVSSDKFCTEVKSTLLKTNTFISSQMTGPANTQVDTLGQSFDAVHSLRFDTRNVLHNWQRRQRQHGWPQISTVKTISKMKGNLVAKGMKGSKTENLEWRLCFGEIELLLTQDLNDTQLKLYKMLKIINKNILKMNVSSYMVKNVVFWLAENHPQSMFREEALFPWIEKALQTLRHFVKMNYLPYYMIPGRNLLTEKISESEREPLQSRLTDLLKEGPCILLHCGKISQILSMVPSDLKCLQQRFEEIERTYLSSVVRTATLASEGVSDEECDDDGEIISLTTALLNAIVLGWPSFIQQQLNECSSMRDKIRVLLS